MVLRDGVVAGRCQWEPYVPGDLALVYSVSKTVTATAVGLAVAEGRFALDDRVADLVGGAPDGSPLDDRVASITVHHLLSMSTGHTADTLEAMQARPAAEWVPAFLAQRPQEPVGSVHVYHNGASFLLGELVRRHTGQDLLDYVRPRLLEPLGIEATWDTDALGRCLGWTGLHLSIDGLAALGELLRCDGVWHGRRLLPEGWVARATARHVDTTDPHPDWGLGYGYQVWMGREGYRLDGAYGQFAFVLPARGLVVAIQSAQSCTQLLVDLVWEHLVVPDRPSGPAGATARVAVPPDTGRGTAWRASGAVPLDPAMVDPGEEPGRAPDVGDVRAERNGGELRLSLLAEGHPVELVAQPGSWRRQHLQLGEVRVPVAVAAGADEQGDLHVRLVLTDTPHTLRLRLGRDGQAGLAWRVAPLQGPCLSRMRAH